MHRCAMGRSDSSAMRSTWSRGRRWLPRTAGRSSVATINRLRPAGLLPAILVGVAFLSGGCGGSPVAKVHGTVTLDGKPVKDGSIEFFPIDGKGQTAAVAIKDGAYSVDASVGEMKGVIRATGGVGRHKAYERPESPWIEDVRETMPARYSRQSELKKTLVAGDNTADFELTTKKEKN